MPLGRPAPRRLASAAVATLVAAVLAAPLATAAPPSVRDPSDAARPAAADAARRAFTIDTNLLSPSGLSAWAIDRYLAANTPLPAIGSAFKAAELKYGINARYLLAHAMLETAYGTSYFALRYRNLFGWNAFDRDPGRYVSRFPTYAAGIDHVAGRIAEWYLRPSGRFWGGAPTLRGMHMYASDPKWEQGIARIANTMSIPTLAGRTFRIETPRVKGTLLAGRAATVTVRTAPSDGGGRLPDGLRVAARWRPVAIVEAGAPPKKTPAALPEFTLIEGATRAGVLTARLEAPDLPGRYRLELQVRDSDGTPLTDGSRLTVPGVTLRVHAQDAVTYDLRQTEDGLQIAIANVGRKPIAAIGTGKAAATLTTVAVWSLPRRGVVSLLTRIPLAADLPPGETWTGVIPPDVLAGAVPGELLLRLEVAGSPGRLASSPPGVFRLEVAQDDPPAGPTPATTQGSASAPGTASTAPVLPALRIHHLTPADPGTPALLGTDRAAKERAAATLKTALMAAAKARAKERAESAKSAARSGSGGLTTQATSVDPPAPVRAIRYQPYAAPSGGSGSVVLTNSGTITYRAAPDGTGRTSLVLTAVPATSGLKAPVVVTVPLDADLAPGRAVEIPFELPSLPGLQPSYLVSVRLVTADPAEQPTSADGLFWLRGSPAAPKPVPVVNPVVSTPPSPSTSPSPSP